MSLEVSTKSLHSLLLTMSTIHLLSYRAKILVHKQKSQITPGIIQEKICFKVNKGHRKPEKSGITEQK